jgi:hypothetical protein
LDVDVRKFLVDIGVVDVDSVKAQVFKHLTVLVEALIGVDVAHLPFQVLQINKRRTKEATACPKRLHYLLLEDIPIVVG